MDVSDDDNSSNAPVIQRGQIMVPSWFPVSFYFAC